MDNGYGVDNELTRIIIAPHFLLSAYRWWSP